MKENDKEQEWVFVNVASCDAFPAVLRLYGTREKTRERIHKSYPHRQFFQYDAEVYDRAINSTLTKV